VTTPRNATEVKIAQIWQEVLGLTGIGVTDDFLELGGDSLLTGQVFSRIVDVFRVDASLGRFLGAHTVEEQAVEVLHARAAGLGPGELERLLAEVESPREPEPLAEGGRARPEPPRAG